MENPMNGTGPVHSEDNECVVIENEGADDPHAVEYLGVPIKQQTDKRQYRPIRLSNGLTALLISDPDGASSEADETQATNGTRHAASAHNWTDQDKTDGTSPNSKSMKMDEILVECAFNIRVGSSSDPPEIPGLARFMEHVIFVRFEKSLQDFSEFVNNNGGWCYAYTSCNKTAFNFAIPEKFLRRALDHFARFFTSSLCIKQNVVVRARQSLHGRQFFRNNLTDEGLHSAVVHFKEEHYRTHNVTIAMEANLPLETLEKYITDCFLSIPKKPLNKHRFGELKGADLLDISRLQRLYRADAEGENGTIEFVWTVPSLYQFCRSKPLEYVSWTIGYKGKGSLIGYLRRAGLCLDISSSTAISHSNCCLFTVTLVLMQDGSKEYEAIGRAVYSYINLMRKEGPKKRIHDDIRKTNETKFRFLDGKQRVELPDLCDNMHVNSSANYLTGNDVCNEWDPVMITACMNELSPEHVNIVIFDEADVDEPRQVEPRFQTKYTETGIAKRLIDDWKRVQPLPQFKLPRANVYVADDVTVLPTLENSAPHPVKIHSCARSEIWYKPYSKSPLPTCEMNLHYISPLPLASPENAAMLDLLVTTLKQLLLEQLYPATTAALHYNLRTTKAGLCVKLQGLNQKIPLLSQTITKSITDCANLVTKQLFDALKTRQLDAYSRTYGRSGKVTKELELSITSLVHWSVIDKHAALDGTTFDEFRHFVNHYCDRLYVQCLAKGNMTEDEVTDSVKKCVELLDCEPLLPNTMPQLRTIEIPRGVHCCRVKSLRPNELSAVRNCYLLDDRSIELIAMIYMLNAMMSPQFEDLRARMSVDWIDIGFLKNIHSVIGYSIVKDIRCSKTFEEIDEAIEDYRTAFGTAVGGLSDRDLTTVKEALAKEKIDDDWNEIVSREYVFDRRARQADTVNRMTIEEIKRGLVDLTANGPTCRKLSIQVVPSVAYEEDSIVTSKPKNHANVQQICTDDGDPDTLYRGNLHDRFEYLTDLPNEQKRGDDYYIVDIEDYKRRSLHVLEGPKSTHRINDT